MIDPRIDKLNAMAQELELMALTFNNRGTSCECCDAFRYESFPQYQVMKRVEGAAIRLREIAGTIGRRQNEPEWIGTS